VVNTQWTSLGDDFSRRIASTMTAQPIRSSMALAMTRPPRNSQGRWNPATSPTATVDSASFLSLAPMSMYILSIRLASEGFSARSSLMVPTVPSAKMTRWEMMLLR